MPIFKYHFCNPGYRFRYDVNNIKIKLYFEASCVIISLKLFGRLTLVSIYMSYESGRKKIYFKNFQIINQVASTNITEGINSELFVFEF